MAPCGLDIGQRHQHERALDAMCDAIVNQLLHAPMTELKRGQESPDGAKLVEAVQRLFQLEVAGEAAVRAEQETGLVLGLVRGGRVVLGVGEDPEVASGDHLLIAEPVSSRSAAG